MKQLIVIIFILSFALFSCKNNKNAREIKQIDSLYLVIDSIGKNLSTIDTVNIKKVYEDYRRNIGLIGSYFEDRKDDSTWSTMAAYGIISKPLKAFIKSYHGLYQEMDFSIGQLDSLKTDIQDNKIAEDKAGKYVKDESDAVNELKMKVDIYVGGAKEKLRLYDSLNPKIIKVIEKLKKADKLSKPGDSDKGIEND